MSPWYVGRFGTIEDAANFKQRMVEDTQYLQAQDEELGLHRDYSPVVVSTEWLQVNLSCHLNRAISVSRIQLAEFTQWPSK
jgi:hypothetical protein